MSGALFRPGGFFWRCVSLAASGLTLAGLISLTPVARDIDLKLEDALLKLSAPTLDFSEVVVVDVDEPSMARLQSQIGAWPYNRDVYGLVTPYLLKAGAKAVAYDILFSEARAGDDEFAATLTDKVILAGAALPYGGAGHDANYRSRLATAAWAHGASWAAQPWEDLTLPIAKFTDKSAVGVISMVPDSDGVIRRIPLLHRAYGEVLPSLTLATLKAIGVAVQLDQPSGGIVVNGKTVPVDAAGLVRLRYPSNFQSLQVVPFYELALAASGSSKYANLAQQFNGKIVYLGSSGAVLGDFHQTPSGRFAGLHLAASLPTLLANGQVIRPRSWPIDIALTLLLVAFALALTYHRFQTSAGLQVMALPGLIVLATGAVAVLGANGQSAGVLLPTLAAVFIHLGGVIWRQVYLYRKSRRLLVEKLAAEEATRLKTQFLSHMTHELRTPLTAILGFNNINWKTDAMGRDARIKNSEVIDRNGRHLLALINGILDQAQLEAGQVRIVTQPENLRVLVGDVIATLKPLVRDKDVKLAAHFASGMPEAIEIDAFRVRQILLNLTGNAIKFTERGEVNLNVSWRSGDLTVEVADTGPGISPEAMSRLFSAFQQADGSIAAKHGGTGLGLTISRDLAELMLGKITLTSELGVGSRFTLQLPASAGQATGGLYGASGASGASGSSGANGEGGLPSAAAAAAAALASLGVHPKSAAFGKPSRPMPLHSLEAQGAPKALRGTVLVAEDAADLRALSVIYLKRLGLTVLEASNGKEAVDLALSEQPDAILMDIEMPVLDGLQAVKLLREQGFSRPILATTAHAGEPHRTLALAAGCNDLLSKPISYAVLRASLDGAMSAPAALV